MRKFEYCTVEAYRDLTKRDYPWSSWIQVHHGKSEEVEVSDGKGILNTMGELGWELLGPPEVTRMAKVAKAFNHSYGSQEPYINRQDAYIDYAEPMRYTFYFKREIVKWT